MNFYNHSSSYHIGILSSMKTQSGYWYIYIYIHIFNEIALLHNIFCALVIHLANDSASPSSSGLPKLPLEKATPLLLALCRNPFQSNIALLFFPERIVVWEWSWNWNYYGKHPVFKELVIERASERGILNSVPIIPVLHLLVEIKELEICEWDLAMQDTVKIST